MPAPKLATATRPTNQTVPKKLEASARIVICLFSPAVSALPFCRSKQH
jgi:hypothetical protein